jgi:uncharacterized protein
LSNGYAVFNANTGSVLRIEGDDAEELSELLTRANATVVEESLGSPVAATLRRGGFLVDSAFDELGMTRERYWTARGSAPVVLLVTTTMDCNLGCYYCYESRSADALMMQDVPGLVAIARERLQRRGKQTLHVDWYGGEPLMNLPFLEEASLALQSFCRRQNVTYHASVVSNGTQWPDDVGAFVRRHRIREAQISFDGLADNHNRRRRYRGGYQAEDGGTSFDKAVALVDRLLPHSRVDIRFNADHGNADDLAGFVEFAKQRGWFDGPFRCVLSVAKLSAYSDRSAFLRPHELSPERYDELQALIRRELPQRAQDDQEIVAGFPHPKTSVCGALAHDSAVVGADGLEYRCGLQVGETHRAVGPLRTQRNLLLQPQQFSDRSWWDDFDPTVLPTCSRCSFLPICWGGCPKRHLDGTRADIDAEGRFWRANLPRMIADGLGEKLPDGFAFSTGDQFRDGMPDTATVSGNGD